MNYDFNGALKLFGKQMRLILRLKLCRVVAACRTPHQWHYESSYKQTHVLKDCSDSTF